MWAQPNKAGSGEIQEERGEVDGHNVFSALRPAEVQGDWRTKHE